MADQPDQSDRPIPGAPQTSGGAPVFVPIVKPPPGSRERRGRIPAWVLIPLAAAPLVIALLLLWWSVAEDLSTPETTAWRFDILFAYLMLVPALAVGTLAFIGTLAQWRLAWVALVLTFVTFVLFFTVQSERFVRTTTISAARALGWDKRSCTNYTDRNFRWGTYCEQDSDAV